MKRLHNFDEVFDAQKLFRLVLDAMANPGKRVFIGTFSEKLFGNHPAFLALGMTLLDNEVSFDAPGDDTLSAEIISLTLARHETSSRADFIFISDSSALTAAIESAVYGSLRDPHKSATLIIAVTSETNALVRLVGPGIKDTLELYVPDAVVTALETRDAQFYEYPQGIDFIIVGSDGMLFCLPRLSRREV